MTARVSEADFPGRIVSDRSWPIAPVQLRPLKPTFAKTGSSAPTATIAEEESHERPIDGPCRQPNHANVTEAALPPTLLGAALRR